MGFAFAEIGDEPYWDETASYRFSAAEVDALEDATAELERLCGLAVEGSFIAMVTSWTSRSLWASRSFVDIFPLLSGILIALHCILAFIAWRWAIASMRKQRYGDVTTSGKSVG